MKSSPAKLHHWQKRTVVNIWDLKRVCNILLGQKLHVYTEHANLVSKETQSQWILQWHLILEKYGPDLNWLKGEKNQAADTLSRLPYVENDTKEHEYNLLELAQMYGIDDIPDEAFPLTYKYLEGQRSDQSLLKAANNKDTPYISKSFVGGSRTSIWLCIMIKL